MARFNPGPIRVENNRIFVKTSTGETQFDVAPLNKALPFYRTFRNNLNFKLVNRWPSDVIRRFIYDFKDNIDEYIARPNRLTQDNLTRNLDRIIADAIKRVE